MLRESPQTATPGREDASILPLDAEGTMPHHPRHPRPEAIESLEMVNAFVDWVFVGEISTPARAGRSSADRALARLFVQAWVKNLTYVKHVWIDVYLVDDSDEVVHAEVSPLDFLEVAGAGGDFFTVDAHVPSKGSGTPLGRATRLCYRLYYQVGDTLYTDGLVHDHEIPEHNLSSHAGGDEPGSSSHPASPKRRNGLAASSHSRSAGASSPRER